MASPEDCGCPSSIIQRQALCTAFRKQLWLRNLLSPGRKLRGVDQAGPLLQIGSHTRPELQFLQQSNDDNSKYSFLCIFSAHLSKSKNKRNKHTFLNPQCVFGYDRIFSFIFLSTISVVIISGITPPKLSFGYHE
jgi:hypothetical protein